MKLKACPFCGRTNVKPIGIRAFNSTGRWFWTIVCPCGCESPKDSVSKQGATRIWNRRRPPLEEKGRNNG